MSSLVNDTSTTSKRSLWPEKTRGLWVTGADKSRIALSNGRSYDDWASALGANTLGYNWANATHFAPATSLPWDIERAFADEFCEAMGTEAVRFFKSGSDAVSCAVRLARAYTKRSKVLAFKECYHGTGDTFGPILWTKAGIIDSGQLLVNEFGEPLKLGAATKHIAAIVLEPVLKAIDVPYTRWLQTIREVCDDNGILLISDEVILGYRHSLRGYLDSVGIKADLYCYGKAMGQGAAVSACCGRQSIMGLLKDTVHFSGTNSGSPTELTVAQNTLRRYITEDICEQLNERGQFLWDLLYDKSFATNGLNSRFEIVGTKAAVEYCFDKGILFPGFCSMTISHTNEQMYTLVQTLCDWRNTQ
mgnify:CR=1 FL=1